MQTYNLDTPIWQLSVGEFLDLQRRSMEEAAARIRQELPTKPAADKARKTYVYGLRQFADLLGCGMTTAKKIKQSGLIDKALSQVGRKIVIDADLAIELLNVECQRASRRRSSARKY